MKKESIGEEKENTLVSSVPCVKCRSKFTFKNWLLKMFTAQNVFYF